MLNPWSGRVLNNEVFVSHACPEVQVDLGEVTMNYAVAGRADSPALLLVPAQAESWWGFEVAMKRLARTFRVYAVDLRGQGRSTRTPGRYTLDNIGNDLARFIQIVIGRPTVVAGNSSGGLLAAWLSAYAPPGLVRGVYLEDPPIFSSELVPASGYGIRQSAVAGLFRLFSTYLGDQWSVGDWKGMLAARSTLPEWMQDWVPASEEPPQNLKEYDPEWARAFLSGTMTAGCSQEQILLAVKTPVLASLHFSGFDPDTNLFQGAASEDQLRYAGRLVEKAGQRFELRTMLDMPHGLHTNEPELYASLLEEWAIGLNI